MWNRYNVNIENFAGMVFTEIKNNENEEIIFTCEDGTIFKMYHEQDCCESVYVEDICGELSDLVNSPILMAEEVSETGDEGKWGDTYTWTFYKLATIKGSVTIRWYGSSNGYYSESVQIIQL